MPTGQTIATNILIALGLCDPGGTPGASDSTDTLNEVNVMLDAWSADESLVYGVATAQYSIAANTNPITIGAGGAINATRPSRISKATFIDSAGTRRALRIVPSEEYFAHGDLTAAAVAPDEIYYDNADVAGLASIYQFPVFSVASAKLELQTWQVYAALSLNVNTPMQQGLQDPIQYGGAWRCITRFGINDQAIIQKIEQLASRTEERYQRAIFGVLKPGVPMPERAPSAPQQQQR